LAAAGALVVVIGTLLEGRTERWRPAAYLTQTAGLVLLFVAYVYSEQAWPDATAGGVLSGVLALATPIVLAPRAMRQNVVMPAVHLTLGIPFLAVFLDRATGLSGDGIVWVLDGVLAIAIFVLARTLARGEDRHPWALHAFVMAMVVGFALISLTALEPLDMEENAVWPLDVWLAMAAGLAVWGMEGAAQSARRALLASSLCWLMVAWIPLGFYTALEALGGPSELPLLLVGGMAGVAFVYASNAGLRELMAAASLAFIAPLWYWAVDRAGALGAVAALAVTAALLLWVSSRTGPKEPTG
jgi:hypothetical protein